MDLAEEANDGFAAWDSVLLGDTAGVGSFTTNVDGFFGILWTDGAAEGGCGGCEAEGLAEDGLDVFELVDVLCGDFRMAEDGVYFGLRGKVGYWVFKELEECEGEEAGCGLVTWRVGSVRLVVMDHGGKEEVYRKERGRGDLFLGTKLTCN